METKILLKLIKDDILHLQGIAEDFYTESMPTADEVELALFRANALLRQLELLHRSLVKNENLPLINVPKGKIKDDFHESSQTMTEQKSLRAEAKQDHPSVSLSEEPIPAKSPVKKSSPVQGSITAIDEPLSESSDVKENAKGENSPLHEIAQYDSINESQHMVNELLSQEKSDSGYQIIPIRSIWDGIGINDRILFVRELFENDSSKFELAVNAMNQLSTLQDAVNYLKMNFKWHKTDASKKFLILVKRRFTK